MRQARGVGKTLGGSIVCYFEVDLPLPVLDQPDEGIFHGTPCYYRFSRRENGVLRGRC
jgi:hypothetical protein